MIAARTKSCSPSFPRRTSESVASTSSTPFSFSPPGRRRGVRARKRAQSVVVVRNSSGSDSSGSNSSGSGSSRSSSTTTTSASSPGWSGERYREDEAFRPSKKEEEGDDEEDAAGGGRGGAQQKVSSYSRDNRALAKRLIRSQSSSASGALGGSASERRRERDANTDEMDLRAAARLLKASPPPRRTKTTITSGSGSVAKKKTLTNEQPGKKPSTETKPSDEEEEAAKTKRRQRRRRKSSAMKNNNNSDVKQEKEGSGDDSGSEKDSLDGVLLDAQSENALGEAVKELLRLEYIAKALDDEEFTMRTRDEEMDARDDENPMATSDAILSIFDAKPKNAMEMIKNDSSSKSSGKRMKAEEDIMYERKFARAAGLNVNELRKRLDAGKRARQILVSKNIGLARLCAHRTMKQRNTAANSNFSYQLSDMISDGQEGLVKAASKFDPSLGFRFSTYAYAWVLSSIQRGLDSNSNTIRTPTHARVEKMKIKNLEKNLEASLGRMPTDEEVARVAGVDVKRIETIGNFGVSYAMQRATGSGTFSDEIGDASEILVADQGDANGATPLADFCTTDAEERALKLVERDLFKDDLEHVFDTLLPRERFVLRHKFGLDEFEDERAGRGNSMANILAKKMGLSVNAVRSIEQRALQKLRAPQRAAILEKHAILPEAKFTFSSNPLRVDDRPITGGVKATGQSKKSVEDEISDILLERVEGTIKNEDVEKIAQSSVRGTTWSSYELKLMSDMRGKGIPWKKVAVAIGRTETSCKQMYRKVGGSTRKHTPSMDEKTKVAMQKIEEGDAIINA